MTADESKKRLLLYKGREIEDEYMLEVSGEEVVLDATVCSNSARYANHSCDANSQYVTVNPAGLSFNVVFIYAQRDLRAGNAVFVDYGWQTESGEDAIICECTSPLCRTTL